MCRHFCYLGPSVPLADLVSAPPHSLVVQSYKPTSMRGGGAVNVDGFGVGWYPDGGSVARRYRRVGPIWHDLGFAELARDTRAPAMLGALRNSTIGMPVSEGACAPFSDGRWLFSLNGRIDGWPDAAVELAATLSIRDLLTLDAPTDAALLWAALRQRLTATSGAAPADSGGSSVVASRGSSAVVAPSDPAGASGSDPAAVLAGLVSEVYAHAPTSRLNTLLTDGRTIYATTLTHTLSSLVGDGWVIVASEPFDDDPRWQTVPDGQLLVAAPGGVQLTPLAGVGVHPDPVEKSEEHVYQRR
jgi:glutamine amidotransferase